jgi:hypothetical protein
MLPIDFVVRSGPWISSYVENTLYGVRCVHATKKPRETIMATKTPDAQIA